MHHTIDNAIVNAGIPTVSCVSKVDWLKQTSRNATKNDIVLNQICVNRFYVEIITVRRSLPPHDQSVRKTIQYCRALIHQLRVYDIVHVLQLRWDQHA
jgi:hypothetical protein